jgi:hypothetical protein
MYTRGSMMFVICDRLDPSQGGTHTYTHNNNNNNNNNNVNNNKPKGGNSQTHQAEIGVVDAAGEVEGVVVLQSEGPAAERTPEVMDVGVEVQSI